MATRELWRRMSLGELRRYLHGEVVKPLPTCDTGMCANSYSRPLMCFFGTANNAMWWTGNGFNSVVACFEVDERYILFGHGKYPDMTLKPSEILAAASRGENPFVYVKEYALKNYSKKNTKLGDWGVVGRNADKATLILNSGRVISRGRMYDDWYIGKVNLKRAR